VPAKLKPRKYRLENCPVVCSLNPRNLPAGAPESIHRWYEQGCNTDVIVQNALALGFEVSPRAVARHKANHLVPEDMYTPLDPAGQMVVLDPAQPAGQLSDLAILDKIIQAGARQMQGQTVRISPDMTMKAMELRLKLTQGSVFDDFMSAVGKAFGADDSLPSLVPEDPDAAADPGELAG
jgi:hypothetical protein